MRDGTVFLGFALVLLATVGTGELLRLRVGWLPESTRRLVHTVAGLVVAVAVPLFESPAPIYALAAAFLVVNLVSVGKGWFPGMHAIERTSIGTVTFPLALIFALLTCWTIDPSRIYVIQIAFVVLALSDPLASLVGTGMRRPGRVSIGANEKSVAGSAAFFASAAAIVAVGLTIVHGGSLTLAEIVLAAVAIAVVATGAEAVATKGWDNFFIVMVVVVPLVWLHHSPEAAWQIALGAAVAVIFAIAAYRARFLTRDGAVAAGGLAFFVIAFGGWAWAAPAFSFFLFSSLLSKIGRVRTPDVEVLAEKGSTRDASQVYANGGIAWLLLVAYAVLPGAEILYWGFAGAFAAAAADTWATEIGTRVRGRTRLIWTGRLVQPGTSGGVSLAGTTAAAAGAAVVFVSLLPFAGAHLDQMGVAAAAALVVGAGFAASLVDSILGATVQGLYREPHTGRLTERQGPEGDRQPVRGWRAVTSDRVNLLCTLTGAALPLAILALT